MARILALENAVSYKTSNRKTHLPYYLVMKEKVLIRVLAHTSQNLIIPIYGKAESLNVAIAGSILSFERLTFFDLKSTM